MQHVSTCHARECREGPTNARTTDSCLEGGYLRCKRCLQSSVCDIWRPATNALRTISTRTGRGALLSALSLSSAAQPVFPLDTVTDDQISSYRFSLWTSIPVNESGCSWTSRYTLDNNGTQYHRTRSLPREGYLSRIRFDALSNLTLEIEVTIPFRRNPALTLWHGTSNRHHDGKLPIDLKFFICTRISPRRLRGPETIFASSPLL
ncbi:hypothetical protein EDD85DRAFT_94828 [Armillaria nabsnona]|nr:hypothetical protein EDD85DRAFT_94828 [Armillaria nabsnona]